MTSNRIAFASAIGLAVLALFMLNGAEADPSISSPTIIPDQSRVDGVQVMNFAIDFDSDGEDVTGLVVEVWFGSVAEAITLTNSDTGVDGTYTIIGESGPAASTLVSTVGSDKISYGFRADWDASENGLHWPGEGDTCFVGDSGCDVRVNTLPVLTDDASVSGGGMPEDTYTLTITYTDDDGHAGTVSATACDASDNCENEFSLTTDDSDFTDGAVYTADFNTNLGGDITVTVSGSDSHDSAEDERTATFTVDTDTPWLKLPSVSPISAGEDDDITFSIVYCVFDDTTGTPSVNVEVGAWGDSAMDVGTDNAICMNGVNYSLTSSVPWANAEQAVTFKASNDVESAANVAGSSITVNDAPTLVTGTAEKSATFSEYFIFNASASDVNSDDGDSFKVYVTIEADSERAMTCDAAGDCTLSVAEADIIDQLGGTRSVSFRVVDDYWGEESAPDTFAQTIEVTRTSSFDWVAPSDGSFQPGSNDYAFTITNNGNFEDTFIVTATSDNGWVATGSESQTVTVSKDATETFTITMDVAHVAAGIVDHWSASETAVNDDTQTNSHDGQTTVD